MDKEVDDPIGAFRGIVMGLVIAAVCWVLILLIVLVLR